LRSDIWYFYNLFSPATYNRPENSNITFPCSVLNLGKQIYTECSRKHEIKWQLFYRLWYTCGILRDHKNSSISIKAFANRNSWGLQNMNWHIRNFKMNGDIVFLLKEIKKVSNVLYFRQFFRWKEANPHFRKLLTN